MDPRNPRAFHDEASSDELPDGVAIDIPDFVRTFRRGAPLDPVAPWCSRWTNLSLEPIRASNGFSVWRVPRLQPMLWYRMHAFNADGTVREGDLLVIGPFDRMVRVPDSIRLAHLIVHMRAGSYFAALGISGAAIAGQRVRARDLWGTQGLELEERLASATDHGERLRLMNDYVQHRFRCNASASQAEVVKGLHHFLSEPRVGDVATLTGWSRRHLERLYSEHVGVSPKLCSLLLRAGDALRIGLGCARPDWARIAIDCAFSDQSHLTRTVTTLFGTPPGRLHRCMRNGGHWLDGMLLLPHAPVEQAC